MRLTSTFTNISFLGLAGLVSLAAACGDDGGSATPDAPPKDIGFNRPTASLKANDEVSSDNWVELGPANLACLNTPSADVANTNPVVIQTKVEDFQSGNLVTDMSVTLFVDQNVDSPVSGPIVSDASLATLEITVPAGTKRFGYKMVNPDKALDTLLLNQTLDHTSVAGDPQASVNVTPQTVGRLQSVSTATGATLPALIGVSRTVGTGVLAGAVRDCDGYEISNFVATVSSTSGTVTHLPGVDTYYFSSSVGLPVRHSQQASSSKDGLFMAIELDPTPTAYVQVWGYKTDADVAADNFELIAELQTSVLADTVITGSYEPLRN